MKKQTEINEQTKRMSEFKDVNNRLNLYLLKSVSNYHFLLFDLFLE